MNDIRSYTVSITVVDGPHGADVSASLRRMAECVTRLVHGRPYYGLKLLRMFQRLEVEVKDVTISEIEYASYLAGLGEAKR